MINFPKSSLNFTFWKFLEHSVKIEIDFTNFVLFFLQFLYWASSKLWRHFTIGDCGTNLQSMFAKSQWEVKIHQMYLQFVELQQVILFCLHFHNQLFVYNFFLFFQPFGSLWGCWNLDNFVNCSNCRKSCSFMLYW